MNKSKDDVCVFASVFDYITHIIICVRRLWFVQISYKKIKHEREQVSECNMY